MTQQTRLFLAAVILAVAGCSEGGPGGAYQAVTVLVLPPDLGSSQSAINEPDSSAEQNVSAGTSEGSGPGSFHGRVVLTGTAPQLPPLIAQGADVKDAAVCAAVDVPDERLVLGADNGVANVFISIQKAPKGSPKPDVSADPVVFDQKNCRFLPHCLIVPVGQTIKVLSDDNVAHNTHTFPKRNTGVSTGVAANDREGKLEIVYKAAEREPLAVKCDFHAWMNAWHFPVDHPYAALTSEDGHFEINGLPPGNHVFSVWHEAARGRYVVRKLKVTIRAGETVTRTIEYPASLLDL